MSSAVSYAYRVREEELRRQRELQAARDALSAAEQRYERARQRAAEQQQTWGDSISLPEQLARHVGSTDAGQLRSATQQLERNAATAEKQLDDEVVAARIAAFKQGMSSVEHKSSGPVAAAEVLGRPTPTRADKEQDGGDAELEETIFRLVSRLEPDADGQAVEKVRAAAELARAARAASGREQGVGALRLLIQEANHAVRESRSRLAILDRSEARLNGFDGPEAAAVRQLVSAIRSQARDVPPDLEAAVGAAIEKETRAQEADYVAAELRGALEHLGYRVGPDFETALLSEGYTQFTRAGWSGYAVRVRTGGHPPHLNFNVVRGEATRTDQEARDREVEQEFCDRQAAVIEQLAEAGIAAERTRVVEPGEKSIQTVAGLHDGIEGEASRPATREIGR